MDDRQPSQNLIEQYGPEVFRSGQAILENRRREYQYNHPETRRPELVRPVIPPTNTPEIVSDRTQNNYPETVKVWPFVGLAAKSEKHGGAWRVWVYAKALDRKGSGWIFRAELRSYLAEMDIHERTQRRWLADAKGLGLLKERGDIYTLASLAAGALALGCDQIGNPATIGARQLAAEGWRAFVWAAYLATLKERPMSQSKKRLVAGVPERTQRLYQSEIPLNVRKNYVKTDLSGDHLTGVIEHGRRSAFVTKGNPYKHKIANAREIPAHPRGENRVMFRLPDELHVPMFISLPGRKGRSRKAQKLINLSLILERQKGDVFRLFHDNQKGINGVLRKLARSDLPPWEAPQELFLLTHSGKDTNLWRSVEVRG